MTVTCTQCDNPTSDAVRVHDWGLLCPACFDTLNPVTAPLVEAAPAQDMVAAVIDECRTMAMVAGQASVEELDPQRAGADARFSAFAKGIADKLESASVPVPSPAPVPSSGTSETP